jgi:CubicO group peptidase (beta-lactamase class C family)
MDIEGCIIEKLSGQPLADYMRDNIFKPLGMRDTGFYVPAEKRTRFAVAYKADKEGKLLPDDAGLNKPDSEPPTFPSGGGGLVSTIEDYYRFAQMLANHGELDGHRILAPATVKLMSTNHLPHGVKTQPVGRGQDYGFNVEVDTDPLANSIPEGKGTYGWDGAAGPWFWVDPENDIVFVGMIQLAYPWPPVNPESRILVYQALTDPSK